MDFVGFYGFEPKLCRVYRAQTKGKVERPFNYIRQDFFIGNKFSTLEELNEQAILWLNNIANTREHGTTKEVPFERLKQECLHPLTKGRVYDTSFIGLRKVSKDCYISYEGNRYSVPYQYSRKTVTIKVTKDKLTIYCAENEETATHPLYKGKGKDICEPKHFEGLRVKQRQKWQECRESFLLLCPKAQEYWEKFLSSSQMRGRWWELRKIQSLCIKYSEADVEYAFRRALKYEAFGYKYVEGILRQIRQSNNNGPASLGDIFKDVLSKWYIPEVEKRPLSNYDQLLNQ